MFWSNKNKQSGLTYIAQSTRLQGKIHVEGDCVIDGSLDGELSATGLVVVDKSGQVEGSIKADKIQVDGSVNGKLNCLKLTITSSGTVDGEIVTGDIEIFNGGQFIGTRLKEAPKLLEDHSQAEPVSA
ncbi:bactofilin family protein [Ferrimonas aestuarii]|uniref:bactofilin family protein n=1 Tax=Ferrimonas aestuarii TaxID=2569539 RepID=UPI00145FA5D3|nr:polymer-forming cytoskeletal protein [Ferrimonas aestuarii]